MAAQLAIRDGESALLQGIRQTPDFRYNILLVESSGASVTLTLQVRDPSGIQLASSVVTLGA